MENDRLILKNMIFYGYHGAFSAEKEMGQRYEVDLEISTDLQPSGQTDDIDLALNHVDLYTIVKSIVEEREFNLIEAIAESIASEIISAYDIYEVTVRVRKVSPSLGGVLDYVEAVITRKGNG